jgi:hypothetical protein
MIRFRLIHLLCVVTLGLLYNASPAQITSENSDRHFIIGARAVGLADSYVAESTDPGAMYWNPAALAFIRRPAIVFNYALERIYHQDNIMTENVVLPAFFENDWTMGIGLTLSHVGVVTEIGGPVSGLAFQQYGVEIGVAKRITPALSLGVLGSGRYGRTPALALGAASSSIGVFYAPSPEISYGMSFQGIGGGIEYLAINGVSIPSRAKYEKSFQMGLSANIPSREERRVVTLILSNQKILDKAGVIYKAAVEIVPVRFLMLRTGYWLGPESVAAKFGAGIRVGRIQLDYGGSYTDLEPRSHQLSLSYQLGEN